MTSLPKTAHLSSFLLFKVSLSVAFSDLHGTIPSELGNLSKLTILDLKNNNLQGSIPATILDLENLQILKLQYNQLSGSLIFFNASFPKCIDVTKTTISLLEGNCDLKLDGEMILIASCLYESLSCSCCSCAYEGIDACDKYIKHSRNLYQIKT
jgi:Leucine rich repeat